VLEVGSGQGFVKIADDVELDAPFAQDVLRAAGLPSAGVEVQQDSVHRRQRSRPRTDHGARPRTDHGMVGRAWAIVQRFPSGSSAT
jgi:hypothetical protein